MVTIQEQTKDKLVLVIDTKDSCFEVSSSGKTLVTGTGGFMALQGGMKLSVNLCKTNPNAPKVTK